jgi:predicted DNA-binding antitoxin AbrB/MazE fold protein
MSQMIQAIYEDGVLKPLEKLMLGEHQQVQITVVEPQVAVDNPRSQDIDDPLSGVRAATGISDLAEHFDVPAVVVPIITLEPEPFDLLRSIPVVVQSTDDGFLATFFDANIGITGDTKEESVANLRLLLVDVFEELEKEEGQLGPQSVRQLAVLRGFIKRRG